MCTEREVVRELSMTAASPSEKDVTMEKIPDNNRPLNRSRTPSRSMPSQALMRSSSSSPEVKPEAASKRRVPSPARPRERPVNPPAPAQEKALEGVDSSLASSHMGKPSSPSFVSTHLLEETSSEVVKASAVPSTTQGRACSSPAAVKSSVSDTTVVSSASVPGQFAKFSSLMNQLARSSSQSVSLENRCSAAPSPGPSKPPPLSSLKERTRLLPQVTASSPAPRSSSSDTKPRLSASTEQPRAATSSLTSSLVSRPSSPSRTGVVKPAPSSLQAPVVSSRNSNKLTRLPSPSRIYSSQPSSCSVSSSPSSVAFARPSSPSLSRPGSQTSASSSPSSVAFPRPSTPTRVSIAPPTTVIAKPRTSTPTRTISTKSLNPSSSSSSILTTRSAIAAKSSSSPAATTASPNRPLTPTRSLTKPTKSSVTSSSTLLAHHQNQPSSFSSPSFANLKTMASAAGSSQNHARCSSPSESPKSITSSGDCSNNSDTSSSMSSGNVATTRKLMPEFQAKQQQQMAAGFKHIQASHKTSARVVPEGLPMSPTSNVKKRCGWITSQSDAALIAYHDEEWGVPVYDERLLFELIVLAGAQAELSWSSILALRDDFRDAFAGFDAAVVAKFNEKKIATLIANPRIRIPEAKIRGAIDNAKRVLEIEEECGSLTNFLWSFVNYKPMVSHYKLSKQVPVKTPKSEALSNELVRRGLRFVGPTTMYVLMQAAGLVNDHLVTCFRHQECASMYDSPPLAGVYKEIQPEKERCSQTDENLSSFSSLFSSKTSPAFEPGPWLNLPVLDTSSRLNSAPCEPLWAELPMIEEDFEDEMEKQTT